MRLLAVLLRDLSLRAANCEAAMKTGVAPVLVQVLHHTPDEVQMSEAATLLRELVDMPQCAGLPPLITALHRSLSTISSYSVPTFLDVAI
jgi:hypothetical protein